MEHTRSHVGDDKLKKVCLQTPHRQLEVLHMELNEKIYEYFN